MRCLFFCLGLGCLGLASGAAADVYEGVSGYRASEPSYEHEVAHDGYGGAGHESDSVEPQPYVVVEAEMGAAEQVEGETILVVQEPEPVAATTRAPPPPRVAPSEQQVVSCPSGVWVDGYWEYRSGAYAWVDGHCVQVLVNYVFVQPRWDFYWNIWWFIPGYYRPCGAYVGFGYYRPWHWFPPYPHPYYRGGRPVPVDRGVPRRATTARPAPGRPSATRVPRHPTTVIHTTPSGRTRPVTLGRAGTGPVLTGSGFRSPDGIVTQPRFNQQPSTGIGRRPTNPSRGFSGGRSRGSGSGWQGSSGSTSSPSRSWGGGRTRSSPSSPSTGKGSSGSSGGRHGGGSGTKWSK